MDGSENRDYVRKLVGHTREVPARESGVEEYQRLCLQGAKLMPASVETSYENMKAKRSNHEGRDS